MKVMLMRLMSKGEYLIVPKGTKFTGPGKLGLNDAFTLGDIKKKNHIYFSSGLSLFQEVKNHSLHILGLSKAVPVIIADIILEC